MQDQMINAEKSLEILYDHYKDSFTITKDFLKSRDKVFIYVILTLTAMFVTTIAPGSSTHVASQLILDKLKITLNTKFLISMLWFSLMCLVLRYLQTTLTIEKQYDYLHELEDQICLIAGVDLVTREGKAYLNNYPVFKKWAHIVYTMFFPAFLLGITLIKIYKEFHQSAPSFELGVDASICVFIWVSAILYLCSFHFRSMESNKGHRKARKHGTKSHDQDSVIPIG